MPKSTWTTNEIKILERDYPFVGTAIPELELNHTMYAIANKAQALGIKFVGQKRVAVSKYREWEDWEDDLIRDHYPYYGTRMPYLHHRKANAIQVRAQKLGVGYERRSRKTRLYHAKAIELYHEWENGDQELSFIEWLEANKWSRDYRNINKD